MLSFATAFRAHLTTIATRKVLVVAALSTTKELEFSWMVNATFFRIQFWREWFFAKFARFFLVSLDITLS